MLLPFNGADQLRRTSLLRGMHVCDAALVFSELSIILERSCYVWFFSDLPLFRCDMLSPHATI